MGAKYTFAFAIGASGFLTMLLPEAAKYSFPLALLTRAAVGLACSSCFVSIYHFFPKWIPKDEKTILVSTVGSGVYVVIETSHLILLNKAMLEGRDNWIRYIWSFVKY
jgi:MFS family permease